MLEYTERLIYNVACKLFRYISEWSLRRENVAERLYGAPGNHK